MKLIPNNVSRFGHRSILKLHGASPTIFVVAGVGGLVVTAVMAARATRDIEPILDEHKQARVAIGYVGKKKNRVQQQELVRLYSKTALKLGKLYAPTIAVGATSTVSVLGGHKILRGRHVATMAAYSGLMEQFTNYRGRVADTLGKEVERGIYNGARGEWQEDPEKKGEYKLQPVHDKDVDPNAFCRPWFDETNSNWTKSPQANYLFLKGVQQHMNNLLVWRGHVFLNEVLDALKIPRTREGQVTGWLYEGDGDGFVDFGFMTSIDPHTVAFCNGLETTVRLNFNIDGPIWNRI